MKLGFGAMRLPSSVDECKAMFAYFLAHGFDYFDTAYIYKGSEAMLKTALVNEHPRHAFRLADKLPVWSVNKQADCDTMLAEQFKRCGVDYFDYYLLHSMNRGYEAKIVPLGVYEWAAEQKRKGLFKKVGFSFHDSPDALEQILAAHPEMDFVQLQLNYMDVMRGFAGELLQIAGKYQKPIIVMEPVKGGTLANLPEDAAAVLREANDSLSAAAWALRYAASLPGVELVLSGMSDMAQVKDNVATFSPLVPMTEAEYDLLEKVLVEITKVYAIPCTRCGYCLADCPAEIQIPLCFSIFNERQRGSAPWNQDVLYRGIPEGQRAGRCQDCGACVPRCPQKIDIPERLKEVAKTFKG